MSISTYQFFTGNIDELDRHCSICHEDLKDLQLEKKALVAHGGNGNLHPIDRDCIEKYIQAGGSKCPDCQQLIKTDLPYSLSEKCFKILKSAIQNGFSGVCTGLISGCITLTPATVGRSSYYACAPLFTAIALVAGCIFYFLAKPQLKKAIIGSMCCIIIGANALPFEAGVSALFACSIAGGLIGSLN